MAYLYKGKDINAYSEDELVDILSKDGYLIKFITNPTEKMQVASVSQYCYNIQYIEYPSPKVQDLATEINGHTSKVINNTTDRTLELRSLLGED